MKPEPLRIEKGADYIPIEKIVSAVEWLKERMIRFAEEGDLHEILINQEIDKAFQDVIKKEQ